MIPVDLCIVMFILVFLAAPLAKKAGFESAWSLLMSLLLLLIGVMLIASIRMGSSHGIMQVNLWLVGFLLAVMVAAPGEFEKWRSRLANRINQRVLIGVVILIGTGVLISKLILI